MTSIDLTWEPRPAEENVVRYEVERRPYGGSQHHSRARRWGFNIFPGGLFRNMLGGWGRVGEVPGSQNQFSDGTRFLARRIFRPTYWHNSEILPYQAYEYRIRGVNNLGTPGQWAHIVIPPGVGQGNGAITGRIVVVKQDPATNQVSVEDPKNSKLPLDAASAKDVCETIGNFGLSHKAEAYLFGTNHKIGEARANISGHFMIPIEKRYFGQRIEVRSQADHGYTAGTSAMGWPTGPKEITLDSTKTGFDHAVVPKMRSGNTPPHIVEGTIHGRIVEAEVDPSNANVAFVQASKQRFDLKLRSDREAKEIHGDNKPNLGLQHKLFLQDDTGGSIEVTVAADGRFSASKIPVALFNRKLKLVSPKTGNYNEGAHMDAWPHGEIVLTQAAPTFKDYAIIAKVKKKSGVRKPQVLIEPHDKALRHVTPLEPPFGGVPMFVASPRAAVVEFDVSKANLGGGASQSKQIHVFFYEFPTKQPMSVNSLAHSGISDIKVKLSTTGNQPEEPRYNDNFHHLYKIDTTTKINLTFNYIHQGGHPVHKVFLAFVAIHSKDLASYDKQLDEAMLEQVLARGRTSQLKRGGVLDFNFVGIITK